MSTQKIRPLLAFVFPPREIKSSVMEMACGTDSLAIFDLTHTDIQSTLQLFAEAGIQNKPVHALVSLSQMMAPSFPKLLEESGITGIWVEIYPKPFEYDLNSLFSKLAKLSSICLCFPIFLDMSVLVEALHAYPGIHNIVLKGCEASGFVGRESTLSLYASVRELRNRKQVTPNLFLWGGIGTSEAASAFLSTGAAGIVFENLHWLTDQVNMDEDIRRQFRTLRPEFTKLVGASLKVCVRVFDKGNSLAVKALEQYVASLHSTEKNPRRKQRAFAARVQRECIIPGESRFDRNTLIPLGVEASFALSFVERYGYGTEKAVGSFMDEIQTLCKTAAETRKAFLKGPLTREMNIRYPFIQGAMTWISDVVDFAMDIADAGGLPSFALGLMDEKTLEEKLGGLQGRMKDRPYAVNLIALPENPFLDVQLKWIKEKKPPFVVIGAGDPALVGNMGNHNIEPVYVAPNTDLLKLAFHAGARYAICEGNEAGGHVGNLTTLTFAQAVIELKRREPSLFMNRRVILAGGIYNGDTVSIAAMLGFDAVQMGTVYLTTQEIVERKALSPLYRQMIISSSFGGTVLTGEAVGLPVRSLRSPKTNAIGELENKYLQMNEDESAFRRELEALTTGSLFIAARGLEHPGGKPKSEAFCVAEGQFMCGVCAGMIDRIKTVNALHEELAEALGSTPTSCMDFNRKDSDKPCENLLSIGVASPSGNRSCFQVIRSSNVPERIVVTGYSLVNSLGNRPDEIWKASMEMKSGVTWVPPSKWNHDRLYDPRPHQDGKTYCRVGAFKNLFISRKALAISPHDFKTMSGSTKETLSLADEAITHSGILNSTIPPERIGVLVSQNSGECSGTLEDIIVRISGRKILDSLKGLIHVPSELEAALKKVLKGEYSAIDDTTLTGRLNATAVGFICNRYGFMGPGHAVTAACASSLVALYNAVQMIRNDCIDVAVVGGGEEALTPLHFLEFSALGALAGLSGVERPPEAVSRPFDAGRDGIVLGEGGGMIVIERETTAMERGAHVHAHITGVGASNTPRGLVEPSSRAAEIAIRSSFKDVSRYGPSDVDLIECHATGTQQGDLEEAKAIRRVYEGEARTVITSFKSQIGHTLGAAGINSLIRGIMAMKSGVFPPTMNCENPDPGLGIGSSGLVLLKEASGWKTRNGKPKRLQINAFGFGGFNYVAHLEESCVDADMPMGLPQHESPSSPRAVAFVFPGQGAQYSGMGKELYAQFPIIRKWLNRFSALSDFDLLQLLFQGEKADLRETIRLQPALFAFEYALARQFISLGVTPTAMAGHSLGELTALCIAGVFSAEDGFHLVSKRGECMQQAGYGDGSTGIMMAVNAPLDLLEEMLVNQEDVSICNINSPNQVVIGGKAGAVSVLGRRLKEMKYRCYPLNVSMAFHSPVMKRVRGKLENFLLLTPCHPPRIPVISNVTGQPYPLDSDEIKEILLTHLESPVHWMRCVQTLWNRFDVSAFVEIGPGDTLSTLIRESLDGADCLQSCLSSGETETFRSSLAKLQVPEKADSIQVSGIAVGRQERFKPPNPAKLPQSADSSGIMEGLIAIIMDATGYERDEIGLHMDLKDELAIRSSRLPVIMDAAERQFGITIELEDFLDVRTVHDAAEKISHIISRDGTAVPWKPLRHPEPDLVIQADFEAREKPTQRLAFKELSLEPGRFHSAEFKSGDVVAILSPGKPGRFSKKLAEIFSGNHGLRTTSFAYVKKTSDLIASGFDIRKEREARRCADRLGEMSSLAGLIIVVDGVLDRRIEKMEDIPRVLSGIFMAIKAFLQSSHKKFVFLVQNNVDNHGHAELVLEGTLGMFLSAALEYASVQFRTLRWNKDTDLAYAIRGAMDKSRPTIENIYHSGEVFSTAGYVNPLCFQDSPRLNMGADHVIVLSGGGRGITAHLAGALRPLGHRLVLLGRTPFDPELDYEEILAHVEGRGGKTPVGTSELEKYQLMNGLEISRTLKDLKASGADACYMSCDVANGPQVQEVMATVSEQYGGISMVIHGAGILKDALLKDMPPEHFLELMNVKLMGAWHLFKAAERHGLKYFMGLSSVAAVHGSPGQVNYASANRALSGLIKELSLKYAHIRFKSFFLPPISGVGMAEDREIRHIMKIKKMEGAYVGINELKELFCREFVATADEDPWVMFSKEVPEFKTVDLDLNDPGKSEGQIRCGTVNFRKVDFPMVDRILHMDVGAGTLKVRKTFSRENDLWIKDHKPFKALKHPMVSSVMTLEAFMEAAKLLYPYLNITLIRNARFMELIDCPPGIDRKTEISCRRIGGAQTNILCEVSLSSQDISPTGRMIHRMTRNFEAQVVLSGRIPQRPDEAWELSDEAGELDTDPIDHEGLLEWYLERSDFEGRYRVVTHVQGTGTDIILGKTVSSNRKDFSTFPGNHYQYSPYLLEAVFHLAASHATIRDPSVDDLMIPVEVGELILHRRPAFGEEITMLCRMTKTDNTDAWWNARCVDPKGRTVMVVHGIRMHRFSV